MRRSRIPALFVFLLIFCVPAPVLAQRGGDEVPRPAPRWTDGRVNLGPPPGEAGLWSGNGRLVRNPGSYEPNNASNRNARVHIDDVPLQEWARAMVDYNHSNFLKDEPHTRCKPSGGPRQFVTPYGFEIVDIPELGRIFIVDIGGPHTYRTVYMDGRGHPEAWTPTYYGHSVGRWEGDTLVIDTVGFNERFWMNRDGLPHTDQMHLIERITRLDFDTLNYEVTIDDPGTYTSPWTSGFTNRWQDGTEMFEYICQDNNLAPELMVGGDVSVDRTGRIAP